jgi:HAD superfamily hydrolase (TIGR01509 family)
MIDTVIFDMDGLMLDTEPIAARAWKKTFRDLGYTLSDEVNRSMIGRNVPDSNAIVQEAMGADFPIALCREQANAAYTKLLDTEGVPLKDGLIELLGFLRKNSCAMAVATSTPRDLALHKLTLTDLASNFKTIVAGDDVARGKPAPDLFLAAARLAGATPAHCVVLEDSPAGIRAGHAAGMVPIMVPDLVEPDEVIRRLAFAVVPNLHEARLVIEKLLSHSR